MEENVTNLCALVNQKFHLETPKAQRTKEKYRKIKLHYNYYYYFAPEDTIRKGKDNKRKYLGILHICI